MLYSIDTQEYIDYVPHEREYRLWTQRLSQADCDAINEQLNLIIEGDEIHTSSWIPGTTWEDTPYFPIYQKACQQDEEAAAKCFGLMLWEVLMHRDDVWGFGRYEKDGIPIRGMTYFRINNPPPK